jgi:hypothetical protein
MPNCSMSSMEKLSNRNFRKQTPTSECPTRERVSEVPYEPWFSSGPFSHRLESRTGPKGRTERRMTQNDSCTKSPRAVTQCSEVPHPQDPTPGACVAEGRSCWGVVCLVIPTLQPAVLQAMLQYLL